jgi:hypothetical protein
MRLASHLTAAVAFLAVAELAIAGGPVTMRESTRIPAEPLGPALRTLANDRGLQLVYDSGQVAQRVTRGASGDLTLDEALTKVLRGTGLTFQKTPDSGIVIEPIAGRQDTSSPPRESVATRSAASSSSPSSDAAQPRLDGVTIQASKDQQALLRRADQFLGAVVDRHYGQSLVRWNAPVCPRVAGFSRDIGEFVLRSISHAAVDARVELAGRVCSPNLYVIATQDPDSLLKDWWAHDRRMYDDAHGMSPVHAFVRSRRPIRVWYNTYPGCVGPGRIMPGVAAAALTGFGVFPRIPSICTNDTGGATLLSYPTVQSILSAVVIIDLRQMKNVTLRQIADYIALVSLAAVRQDPDAIPTPTILRLFGRTPPPQGLSPWDQALLYSLYNTTQASKLQVQEMEIAMTRRIAR